MQTKPGSETWIDPDDAPPLTSEMLADAEVFHGDTPVRRGRGRPVTGNARELISVRLDADLVAKLRAAGPGWQSQINPLLRAALQLDQQQCHAVPVAVPQVGRVLGFINAREAVLPVESIAVVEAYHDLQNILVGREAVAGGSKPASRPAKVKAGKPHAVETLKR